MAERQGEEERQEEGRVALDAEEEIRREERVELQSTQALDAARENIKETYSRETVAADVVRGTSEAGMHVSEETTRRRLYETPGRRAAVLEMKSGGRCVPGTKSTSEGEKTFVYLHMLLNPMLQAVS